LARLAELGSAMLFLLNDAVLNLKPQQLTPPLLAERFAPLTLACVQNLGAELYSEDPLLQHNHRIRAERLAMLIVTKAPEVNAALFIAPKRGCDVRRVGIRYASLGPSLLAGLVEQQERGAMSAMVADREVWGRLAA
jgi:hypothetical protein